MQKSFFHHPLPSRDFAMNTAMLHAFVTVMETHSVSRAAERLCLTQPAVSKRLHNLEEEFGVKLFDTIGRGIQPTAAAQQLLPQARQWLRDYAHMRHQLGQPQDQVGGTLSIGTSHHIGLHHLADPLKQFAQDHPHVQLDVHFVDSEQAHQAVLSGELELAFLTLPPQYDSRLSYLPVWPDPLGFVVAPFHPLAQREGLTVQDLLAYPAILPAAHTYTSQITLAAFAEHGLTPQATMSTNPLESIRMLVSIGLGWSVLPQTLVNLDLSMIHPEPIARLERMLGLVWHPARTHSRAAQLLSQLIQQQYAQH
jgi:DNA-binding transcriptional LysR family regulator